MKILDWILSIVAAFILLQTLFFKFSGAEESIYIFTTVGMEPWGRYGSGIVELIAGVLLLIPKYRVFGSILSVGVISGAIFFHLTILGIEIHGDGGLLFYYALTVLISSLAILVMRRKEIPFIGDKL
ncbi:MAG: putative oxidoreductase [Cyclobacteriaceae bacterium]|jgi:putative oxidoreductase